MSAYGCEPGKGSEPGVGWHWVLEIARAAEVWVITRRNNKEAIEVALPTDTANRIHFIYYDLPPPLRRFKRQEKGLYLYYALWQWGAYLKVKKLLARQSFDYCQHLTFGSMWMPTFMYKLPIPFIWGPVGGGEAVPFGLIAALPWRSRIVQFLRRPLIRLAMLNPLFRGPARRACAVIARTEDSAGVFRGRCRDKVRVTLETGMTEEQLIAYQPMTRKAVAREFRLIYVGRLVPSKNVAMGIRAVALARAEGCDLRVTIVGDGPSMASLVCLSESLGLSGHIDFGGAVTQREVVALLQQNDAFLFPSLKEGGTWALIEAMAVGLPVICVDASGMHVITDESCAIRIPPSSAELMTRQMADAIVFLARSLEVRESMGACARQRISEHFLWRRKGDAMMRLFAELERTDLARTEQ